MLTRTSALSHQAPPRGLAALFAVVALGMASSALAQPPWPVGEEAINLGPHLEYLVDTNGTLTLEQARGDTSQWVRFEGETPSFGFTSDVYWFRTKLPATPPQGTQALLHISYPLLDQIDFYAFEPGQALPAQSVTLGDRVPFGERAIKHRHFLIDLAPSGSARDIYLRIQTTSSMNVPLSLVSQESFFVSDEALVMAYGLLFGSMIVMILYNIIIYLWTRENNYLVYCGYALGLVLLFVSLQGFSFQYLWPESLFWHEKSIVVIIASAVAAALSFNLGFLNLKEELPRLYPLGKLLIAISLVTAILAFLLPYSIAIRITIAVLLPSCVYAMASGIYLLKRGFRPARYYVVSWAAVVIGAVMLGMNRAGLLPVNVFTDNILLVGATAQLMLLSYALADRVNQIKADKERIQREALEDQRRASGELKIALEKAEEASRLKSEFLANISHELRTPLNAIVNLPSGMLENFERAPTWSCANCGSQFQSEDASDITPPADYQPDCPECSHPLEFQTEPTFIGNASEQIHYLTRIETSGRHLLGVVNDLLDISKLEADRMNIYPEPFPIVDMLREVETSMESLAEAKSIKVSYPNETLGLTLDADRIKVAQILVNLIGNAIKFTPEGGDIFVRVQEAKLAGNNALRFEVEDTGVGIPEASLGLIFESFRQVDGSHTRKHQGTGLGLAITQRLVLLHGGTIDVSSEENKGSLFSFVLPLIQIREDEELTMNEGSRDHA